jgi:hypothetical protein
MPDSTQSTGRRVSSFFDDRPVAVKIASAVLVSLLAGILVAFVGIQRTQSLRTEHRSYLATVEKTNGIIDDLRGQLKDPGQLKHLEGEIAQNITGVASAAEVTTEGVAQSQQAVGEPARMSSDLQSAVSRFQY